MGRMAEDKLSQHPRQRRRNPDFSCGTDLLILCSRKRNSDFGSQNRDASALSTPILGSFLESCARPLCRTLQIPPRFHSPISLPLHLPMMSRYIGQQSKMGHPPQKKSRRPGTTRFCRGAQVQHKLGLIHEACVVNFDEDNIQQRLNLPLLLPSIVCWMFARCSGVPVRPVARSGS